MAKSQYEYVKAFELPDALLPDCWLVVRVDGHRFHAFSAAHNWHKPQDDRQIALMNETATRVMQAYPDITLAIGMSDEYSFVLPPHTQLYGRRREKLTSCIGSLFASTYTLLYSQHFPSPPSYPPHFDARTVLYPTAATLHDYLRWRQVDCHINHLHNLTNTHMRRRSSHPTGAAVEAELSALDSSGKNELLWREFGVNYNDEKAVYRKGSIVVWERYSKGDKADELKEAAAEDETAVQQQTSEQQVAAALEEVGAVEGAARSSPARQRRRCVVLHEDLITAPFFTLHPGIIPPITNTEWKKQLMTDERKAKKEQYKAAAALGKKQQQPLQAQKAATTSQQSNASTGAG